MIGGIIAIALVLGILVSPALGREPTRGDLAAFDVRVHPDLKWDAYEAYKMYRRWEERGPDDYLRFDFDALQERIDRMNEEAETGE
jgi:hypothetical protein